MATSKRIKKKQQKKFIASITVLTQDQVDYNMKRPGFVDVILGGVDLKQSLKEAGYVPLTDRRYKQEVKRAVKKLRFHNKWRP